MGKSTLINQLVGKKIAITSRRPQTTREKTLGIFTAVGYQIVFVDTPGLSATKKNGPDRAMFKTAISSMSEVDLVVFMIDQRGWYQQSLKAFEYVRTKKAPIILLINKIDRLPDKTAVLPLIEQSQSIHQFSEIIPISATRLEHPANLCDIFASHLPEAPKEFSDNTATDRTDRFFASELVREQTFLLLGQELPYSINADTTKFEKNEKGLLCVDVTIWVEKQGQKSIVIGKNGLMLKRIGTGARIQMEKIFSSKVFLSLWVKIKHG